jgi:hypothetical protein
MKKLWLNALSASLILGAVSFSAGAHAGDHYRDHDGWRDRHEHGRYCDDYGRGHYRGGYYRPAWREYRPVYYRPAPVYYRPAEYYPAPVVYRERGDYYDDGVHATISVGF